MHKFQIYCLFGKGHGIGSGRNSVLFDHFYPIWSILYIWRLYRMRGGTWYSRMFRDDISLLWILFSKWFALDWRYPRVVGSKRYSRLIGIWVKRPQWSLLKYHA